MREAYDRSTRTGRPVPRRVRRRLTVVLVGAMIAPLAGSFLPSGNGRVIFGDVANAASACKWNGKPGPGSITNRFESWYGWAYVRTGWCYARGNVISRHSVAAFDTTVAGKAARYVPLILSYPKVKHTRCYHFNGYPKHNCLTRYEFRFWNITGFSKICIHTRVYGNGAHNRQITTGIEGYCSP